MIQYILQYDEQNLLQVHYTSGVNRWVYVNQYMVYPLTKTQTRFMDNSIKLEIESDNFGCGCTYWINRENPDHSILEYGKRNKATMLFFKDGKRIEGGLES